MIFLDDHEPAHVHVFGDGHAKINLSGENGPTLVWAVDMKRGDLRRILRIVAATRDEMLAQWNDIHG